MSESPNGVYGARLEALKKYADNIEAKLAAPKIDPEAVRNELSALKASLGVAETRRESPSGASDPERSGGSVDAGNGSAAGATSVPPPDASLIVDRLTARLQDVPGLQKTAVEMIESQGASFVVEGGETKIRTKAGEVLDLDSGFSKLLPAVWFRAQGATGSGGRGGTGPRFQHGTGKPGILDQYAASGHDVGFYMKHRDAIIAAKKEGANR